MGSRPARPGWVFEQKELLRTDMTLREIADQTGFTTTLTLTSAMKRYEAMLERLEHK